jgi:hypothetical protein
MDSRSVNVMVDNYPPEWPADPAPQLILENPLENTARYEGKLHFMWPVPTDGFFRSGWTPAPVERYDMGVGYNIGEGHNFPIEASYEMLPPTGEWQGNQMGAWVVQPFTPYRLRPWALSPRGLVAPIYETADESTHMHTDWCISSPRLDGTAAKVTGKWQVSLTLSEPNFNESFTTNAGPLFAGWEHHIEYNIYRDTSYGGLGDLPGVPYKAGLTWAEVNDVVETHLGNDTYYQVEAVLPPVDFLAYECPGTVRSNVVRYTHSNHTVNIP